MEAAEDPVETTARGLLLVNNRPYIVPTCEKHRTWDTDELVEMALKHGGTGLLKDCIDRGVLTEAEAREHAPSDVDF